MEMACRNHDAPIVIFGDKFYLGCENGTQIEQLCSQILLYDKYLSQNFVFMSLLDDDP